MSTILLTGIVVGNLIAGSFLSLKYFSGTQQAQPLNDLKWVNRVIIIFMPEANYPAATKQIQLFKAESKELEARDLLLIPVVGNHMDYQLAKPGDGLSLRKAFKVPKSAFALVLIGKDGTEKFRATKVVKPTEIFRIIDAMPMRKAEINR